MIRINLLPVRASKKSQGGRQQLLLIAAAVVLALAGNFVWWTRTEAESRDWDEKIARTKTEIAQLEKTIGEVKTITQEKKALEDKLKILDNLKKGRTGPVKVMDELASLVPPKVWLADYTESNNAVSMRGNAVSYEDLSQFSKKLKASKRFRDVVIRKASQRADGVVEWDISCVADYSA